MVRFHLRDNFLSNGCNTYIATILISKKIVEKSLNLTTVIFKLTSPHQIRDH